MMRRIKTVSISGKDMVRVDLNTGLITLRGLSTTLNQEALEKYIGDLDKLLYIIRDSVKV